MRTEPVRFIDTVSRLVESLITAAHAPGESMSDSELIAVHPEVAKRFWRHDITIGKTRIVDEQFCNDDPAKQEPRPCAACGSDDTRCVGAGGGGSVGGGASFSDHHCNACGYYSNYEREWG